jgi:DNA polymerase
LGADRFVPDVRALGPLAEAAKSCRGCDLYRDAADTVFGAGPESARMMLVGEQPGDREDRAGQPFVGPAGKILDKALEAAGVERDTVYVTNAVKHFKFVRAERGQRRIHKTPSRIEVVACRPWLFAELETVTPDVVVLMGATAAKALLGNDFRLTAHRREVIRPLDGRDLPPMDADLVVTVHPSSILRGPSQSRDEAFDGLVADLRFATALLA